MRILFLTQVLPYPPDSGGKIKAFNLIRYLAQQHEVILASLIRSSREREYLAYLQPYCRRIEPVVLERSRLKDAAALFGGVLSGRPFSIERDRSPEMQAAVNQLVEEERPDVLHVVQLNMAQYVRAVNHIPKILDQENAVSTVVERLYRLQGPGLRKALACWEWRRLARHEGEVCKAFDHVLTVTEEDKRALQRLTNGQGNFTVVPIGIDCDAVQPILRKPGARNIISIGNLHWPPNADGLLWFAREIFPLVRQQIPDARFYIVGKNPPREVCRLQDSGLKQPATCNLKPETSIVVTGYVEDPTPYFADSAVFIVPLRAGGGMRVKILDAWARGIPIVSTTIGCEGIEVRDGENILIADIPQDFAQAVARVIRDRELAQRLAENGRKWVEEKYDWRKVYQAYDEVYRGVGDGNGYHQGS